MLTGTDASGKRTYEVKEVLFIPCKTHMKELPAIGGELHKMQVGEWLLEDPEAAYCYVADGANSQQKENDAEDALSHLGETKAKAAQICSVCCGTGLNGIVTSLNQLSGQARAVFVFFNNYFFDMKHTWVIFDAKAFLYSSYQKRLFTLRKLLS